MNTYHICTGLEGMPAFVILGNTKHGEPKIYLMDKTGTSGTWIIGKTNTFRKIIFDLSSRIVFTAHAKGRKDRSKLEKELIQRIPLLESYYNSIMQTAVALGALNSTLNDKVASTVIMNMSKQVQASILKEIQDLDKPVKDIPIDLPFCSFMFSHSTESEQ